MYLTHVSTDIQQAENNRALPTFVGGALVTPHADTSSRLEVYVLVRVFNDIHTVCMHRRKALVRLRTIIPVPRCHEHTKFVCWPNYLTIQQPLLRLDCVRFNFTISGFISAFCFLLENTTVCEIVT